MDKMERVCKACGNILYSYFLDDTYCSKCGEPLYKVLVRTDDDIFVKALPKDHIAGVGFHVRCGLHGDISGSVETVWTTSGKKIYRCLGCGLRIPESDKQ